MTKRFWLAMALYVPAHVFAANCFAGLSRHGWWLGVMAAVVIATHLVSGKIILNSKNWKLRANFHGALMLSVFCASTVLSVPVQLMLLPGLDGWGDKVLSVLVCVAVEAMLFWHGILAVYVHSKQLGVKLRVWGFLLGMVPIANLIMLSKIIRKVLIEVRFEVEKEWLNRKRKAQAVCGTKYPVLLVHGVFFRDSVKNNYWGRIPAELIQNGAKVYYGEHPSALSVADSAAVLAQRIRQIAVDEGWGKVNIIAHSKGGLDCRYAIAFLDCAPYVASLTTVNTPHRGCLFADHLLEHIPEAVQQSVAAAYNGTLTVLGDRDPNFMGAVSDLTAGACGQRDEDMKVPEGIFTQSIGSIQKNASGGQFPLNFTYNLVEHFDGANDGLVAETSFAFGQNYILLEPVGERGISHGDVIDNTGENIDGFDVREFYVELVSDLKKRGL